MDLGIEDRVVMVTGAAGGIGRETARTLAAEGCRLVLADLRRPDVEGLDPGRTLAVATDVTDEASLAAAVGAAERRFGGLDVVVGCHGVSGPVGTPLEAVSADRWRHVLDVNATGSFLLLRAAAPLLRRGRDAVVVLVASDSALVAAPGMAPYCASKAAVLQLARAASVDLAPDVRVVAVCPSVVDTPMSRGDLGVDAGASDGFDGAGFPVQRPEEVAAAVAYLSSPRARAVNGTALVSDFGYGARSGFPA